MSVQPVQSHPLEATIAGRRHSAGDVVSSRASSGSTAQSTQQDAVTVSDRARQLAAGQPATPAPEGPRLQLDFRQLRDLAFKTQSQPSPEPAE